MKNAARVRFLAAIAFTAMLIGSITFIISAARVLATGQYSNIWDFSEVTFLDTFSNGLGLVILFLGILGVLVALKEAYSGIDIK